MSSLSSNTPLKFAAVALATFLVTSAPAMWAVYDRSQPIDVSMVMLEEDAVAMSKAGAGAVLATLSAEPSTVAAAEPIVAAAPFCGSVACHQHGSCVTRDGDEPGCRCNAGYIGDGAWCGLLSNLSSTPVAVTAAPAAVKAPPALLLLSSSTPPRPLFAIILTDVAMPALDREGQSTGIAALQEKVIALQSHGDVIYVCSATERLPSKLDGVDVVWLPVENIGGLLPLLWRHLTPAQGFGTAEWTIVLSASYVISDSYLEWQPQMEPNSLRRTLEVLLLHDAASPILLGKQMFDPAARPHAGESFLQMEQESWSASCSSEYFVVSLGFLQMYQRKGLIQNGAFALPSGNRGTGWADDGVCMLGVLGERTIDAQMAHLGLCLYEQFGMQCRSLTDFLEAEAPEVPVNREHRDGWGAHWRHAQWNCSIALPVASPPMAHTEASPTAATSIVSAVCQEPLLATPPADVPEIMASAPDNVGDFYKLYRAPAEVEAGLQGQQRFESNTVSWMLSREVNATFGDLTPVVYSKGEPRDAVFVVGAGEHMQLKPIEVFIRSLRSTGCRAEIVAFMDKRCIADFVPMAEKYGGIRLIAFEADELNSRYTGKKAVVIYRFVLYEHWLRAQPKGLYKRCLHADLFDTYFQRDPFASIDTRGGMAVFTENPAIGMALCRYHRGWFTSCKDGHLLHKFHNIPRVCMGVVIAEFEHFIQFLRLTVYRMTGKYNCNDQGVLNILLWSGQYAELMPVTIYTARRGPVFHANTEWDFSYSDEGMVLNPDKQPYAVVHQWDRLMKTHPRDDALAVNSRQKIGIGAPRHKGMLKFWFNPKQSWDNSRLVPVCNTTSGGPSNEIVCVSGHRAKHGSLHAAFCPTHTAIRSIGAELMGRLKALPRDDQIEWQPQIVAKSPFLSCTAAKLAERCAGSVWCTVRREHVDAAVHACQSENNGPIEGEFGPAKPADLAANNFMYRCEVR